MIGTMHKMNWRKSIIGLLIVSLLNLLLVMRPDGMVMADQAMEMKTDIPCHSDTILQPDLKLDKAVNCPDGICKDYCTFCVQIGAVMPASIVLLEAPKNIVYITINHINPAEHGCEVIPPPPKTLTS